MLEEEIGDQYQLYQSDTLLRLQDTGRTWTLNEAFTYSMRGFWGQDFEHLTDRSGLMASHGGERELVQNVPSLNLGKVEEVGNS